MRLLTLAVVLGEICCASARTLPLRRFEANLIPLAITQDRDGLLWIATAAGAWRFDGLHFEKVETPAGIDLSGASVLAAGRDGSIWLGTAHGLVRYRDGNFTTELSSPIGALIATRAGRVLAIPAEHDKVYVCAEADRIPCQWSSRSSVWTTGALHEDLDGNVWLGAGAIVWRWTDADVIAAPRAAQRDDLHFVDLMGQPLDLADVVATPDQTIWGRSGPDVLRIGNGRVVSRVNLPLETYDNVRPQFLLDHRGRLWMPGRPLSVIENGALAPFDSSPALENVSAIFEDRNHTLWFGLAGKGLAALPDEAELDSFSAAEGIPGSVLDLTVHPELGLVAAADCGAFALGTGQRRWQSIASIGKIALRSVAIAADGALLFLPHSNGLFRCAAPFRSAAEIPIPTGIDPSSLRKLLRDADGNIGICLTSGLLRMDPAGHIQRVILPAQGVHASDLAPDTDGHFWVGYEGGVAHCAGETCKSLIGPGDGLIDGRIRSIAPTPVEVWVAYRQGEGFSRFAARANGWSATQFKPENGYGPVDTHFVRRDRRGWIWRGSTDGVYVSDGTHTDPEDWIHLTFGDRVNASYANMYGFLEAADGSIWIGTQGGVVHLHPRSDWFAPLPVKIRRVTAAPGSGEVEIHLSRPGSRAFQSRLFRYRMLPLESAWRFSADGTLRYPKLRDGAYRLEIAGNPPAELLFRVGDGFALRAPLWILFALISAGGLTYVLVRRRRSAQTRRYWEEKQKFLQARDPSETLAEDWSGRVLGDRFLLQQRIARGGFAAVYRALDQANASLVAVKLLHPLRDHTDWRRRRFAGEVAALETLNEPGIVRILQVGEAEPDRPYLVMEFLDGVTLRDLLADGALEWERAARLLEQIGDAVAAAHRSGILHRDLKPENVMVLDAGSSLELVKLVDFGIANTCVEQTPTHSTHLAGSSGYVAPERWVGLETYASDIYSLAAIAWEMLTGESHAQSAMEQRIGAPPALPKGALELLRRGLAYDPEKRPQDAGDFVRDLSKCLLDGRPAPAGGIRLER